MNLYNYIKGSFGNEKGGASGKKLTALAVTLTYIYSHRFLTTDVLTGVLVIDAGLITALFGINEVGKFKNKETENTTDTTIITPENN
jgi:hypothetical protein